MNTESELTESINNLIQYINGTFDHGAYKTWGLCDIVTVEGLDIIDYIDVWLKSNTGSLTYPIECTHYTYTNNLHKHDRRTNWGQKRLRYAEFLLTHLQQELWGLTHGKGI